MVSGFKDSKSQQSALPSVTWEGTRGINLKLDPYERKLPHMLSLKLPPT